MASFVEGNRKSYKAGADLSGSQFLAVKLSAAGIVVLSGAASDKSIGILMNKPKQNDSADVYLRSGAGTCKAVAGGTINLGDPLAVNASGQLVAATQAAGGAQPTTQLMGYAQEPATTGQVFEFMPSIGLI